MSAKPSSISDRVLGKVETREISFYRAYHQILGLWGTIPQSVLSDRENEPIVASFNEAKEEVGGKLTQHPTDFDAVAISSGLYRMEAALIELLPIEDLIFRLEAYRDEFRNLAGEEAYVEYMNSIGYKRSIEGYSKPANEKYIRADANYLISQTQRYSTILERAETTRTYLLSKLWRYTSLISLPLLIPILIFFADLVYFRYSNTLRQLYYPAAETRPVEEEGQGIGSPGETTASKNIARVALLCFVGIAGAFGAFVSALNRIQQLRISQELSRHSLVIRSAASQLKWSPITGVIFAVVLSLLFLGGLIQGGLFPNTSGAAGNEWTGMLYVHLAFAKLMIWSFIAGFSERFVPDLLGRFISNARREGSDDKVSTSVVRATNVRVAPIDEHSSPTRSEANQDDNKVEDSNSR